MLAPAFSQVAHAQRELAVPINTAALQPCLLEQALQPLIVLSPSRPPSASTRSSRWGVAASPCTCAARRVPGYAA